MQSLVSNLNFCEKLQSSDLLNLLVLKKFAFPQMYVISLAVRRVSEL